jgi:hypothetical protein
MNIRLFASVLVRSGQDAVLFLGTDYVFDLCLSFLFFCIQPFSTEDTEDTVLT